MSLRLFSLSPLNPRSSTFDLEPNRSDNPYAEAEFIATGVTVGKSRPWSLSEMYNNDRLILYSNPVSKTDQDDINTIGNDFYRKCVIHIKFRVFNIGAFPLYRLVFRLKWFHGQPAAQFFIGNSFVGQRNITSTTPEYNTIWLGALEDTVLYATVRLAGPANEWGHGFRFMGVDCFLEKWPSVW